MTVRAAEPSAAYREAWNNPELKRAMADNIEKYRKADAELLVVDADGKPLAGAKVRATQQTHDFLFGCNAFMIGCFDDKAQEQKYTDAFVKLFNFATVPFYWSDLEPKPGQVRFTKDSPPIFRRPPPDLVVEWGQQHKLTLKGHPLIWHAWYPGWLPKEQDEVTKLAAKRFAQIAERYADKISIWDVTNEVLAMGKQVMTTDYPGWCYAEAARLFRKDNVLMINETTGHSHKFSAETSPYFKQIKGLMDRGLRVDGIGFQFHLFGKDAYEQVLDGKIYKPQTLHNIYGFYEKLDRPQYITEITIPQRDDAKAQATQAEVVANFYRLWFSMPRMAGITWWNLGDGTAVKGENTYRGGLLDEKLDPKESYKALDRLINHEWKTTTDGQTDAAGKFAFRGFAGTYKVEVDLPAGKQTFEVHVAPGQKSHTLKLAK